MALQLSTNSPTFSLTMQIDDEPVRLHIKRLTKAELIAFRAAAAKHEPRGIAEETDDERALRQAGARAFTERCICDYLTFEPGDVTDVDAAGAKVDIVTGPQIVEAFYNRADVLDALASAVYGENCMGKAQKKTWKSSHAFSPGSTPRTPTPVGAAPAPPASPVAPADSASGVAVTASNGPAAVGDTEG